MLRRIMVSVSALAFSGAAYAQSPPAVTSAGTPPGCDPQANCAAIPPQSGADRAIYEAAYFQQFNPRTALDMVRQTPGFALNGGDERRGFSGAVGNLLIDGVRPTSKSQSLDNILSRIPASQVLRVEVLRGAEVAGDASGQAVLLNVVRTETAGSGVWSLGFEHNVNDFSPQGEASFSGRNGQVEYGVGGSYYSQQRSLPGWRRLYDGAGVLTETADTPSLRDMHEWVANGNIAFPLLGGRVSATTQYNDWRFNADNDVDFFDPAQLPTRSFASDFEEGGTGLEVGLNFDRDIGAWTLQLIGLVNRKTYDSGEFATNRDGGGIITSTVDQAVSQESGESIVRGTLATSLTDRHRLEFGGEIAYNTLDQELALTGNPPLPPIPNSNVSVEEERAELFGVHTWRLDDDWSVESRLAWETSTLTFSGDANQTVELSFWKPSIQISHTFGGNDQIRFRVYRDVGQLDFGDFVSAAALADELISGGNPDLVPQTDWRLEIGADFRFANNTALSLTLTRHSYTDVADVVLITIPNPPDPDIRFDAPGNIGDGEALSLDINFSSPVPFIPGGRLTLEGSLWDTEVTDPVTGAPRIISFRPESSVNVEFRQDLNSLRLAWGFNLHKEGEFQAYRFNEIDTAEEGPWIDAFVETTALPNNMKLRLVAANVAAGTINRDRRFFESPDRTGPMTRRDLRERRFDYDPWVVLELSGTF